MASFDFINAATTGYRFTWKNREMIARYMLPLFLVKIATFVIITSFEINFPPLRQGLVMLPSYIIEGWVLAVLIRFYMAMQGHDFGTPRTVLASTLIYVLIKLFLSLTAALTLMSAPPVEMAQSTTEPSLQSFIAALIAIAVMVWAFRLMWFYIPAAFGYSLRDFAEKISSYATSLYMIGTWMVCFLPAGFVLMLVSQALLSSVPEATQPGAIYNFVMIAAQAVTEIFVSVVATIAMTEGIRSMLFDKKKS